MIANLLRRYVATRDEIARLTYERAQILCDFEDVDQFSMGGRNRRPLRVRARFDCEDQTTSGRHHHRAAAAPCWMFIETADGESGTIGDQAQEGWCEPCQRRQELHKELRAAKRQIGPRLGALIASGRASMEIPAWKPPEPTPKPGPSKPPTVAPDDNDTPF